VKVNVQDGVLVAGKAYTDLGHLPGSRNSQNRGGNAGSRRILEYVVQTTGPNPVFTISVISEKGGASVREIHLSQRDKS